MIAPVATPAHYPTDGARRADLAIHLVGLALSLSGGATLMSLSSGAGRTSALAVYATGFVLMMTFSMAYNFSNELRRPFLRRLDHVGIFLMIAGSYTPFTTQVLTAGWAWGMTIGVWSIAGTGIIGKIAMSRLPQAVSIAIYLGLSWLVLVAIGPIASRISALATILLALGGLVYTIGAVFYATRRLPFWRPIWHAHVVAAASAHWAAIFLATVLPAAT